MVESRIKQVVLLLVYYLSPVVASIIYWFEEPLDSVDMINNLIHRTGSIIGIFGFIWMCFNIIIQIKLKSIEENFSLDGIIRFHTLMATIAIILGSLHYPLVRLEREYSSFQIRSGSIGFMIFVGLMLLALIFMSNRLIKYKFIDKLRSFASGKKFKYGFNKFLHSMMILGVSVIFIHAIVSNTSNQSILMLGVYTFFFVITFTGWFYHKIIRRFRSNTDPYSFRKASWDTIISENNSELNKEWALDLIKHNPSLYPCLQCGTCTDVCPISEITKGEYNPRTLILAARSGYKDLVLGGEEIVIWGCTTCNTCEEMCPQNIELTKIFTYLKNQSIILGKVPDYIHDQVKKIYDHAKAIPLQAAIEKRRSQLGLPKVVEPDVNEVQILLRNLGIDKKIGIEIEIEIESKKLKGNKLILES